MKSGTFLLGLAMVLCICTGAANPGWDGGGLDDMDQNTDVGRAVCEMVDAGFISVLSPGRFGPAEPISAGDYVRMICLQLDIRPVETESAAANAGYLQAALDAGWYDWDEIPPDEPLRAEEPISRELGANIVVAAFFGRGVSYDFNVESAKVSDFSQLSGRYYFGVLGGLAKGIFDHASGTPFYPRENLSRGEACLWVANAAADRDAGQSIPVHPDQAAPASPSPEVPTAARGGVASNGWLQVIGTQLSNQRSEPIVLHGMSSHGIQWFPQYTNYRSIENTALQGANVFRVAMYVEQGGYMQNPDLMKERVIAAVENARRADAYVIIDWHILEDGNPLTHVDAAAAFFDEMSRRYADVPNVIYEICNEPNGNITWCDDVKPYAERIVSIIRSHAERSIILIGSPSWDQDVDQAAADPVSGHNLMYTLHFYAGTHHQPLRDKADRAMALGAPIFVSEWGTSAADGSGGVFVASSDEWIAWMNSHRISWCNWSLCDKNESSAALVPGTSADILWTTGNLSDSGRYVFARFGGAVPSPAEARVITVAQALSQFGNPAGTTGEITRNGERLNLNDAVSTGCLLLVRNGDGSIRERRTVVVMGDVLGTGHMSIAQVVAVARALTGQMNLTGPYLAAADFGGNGRPSIADLVHEARLLAGTAELVCRFETVDDQTRAALPKLQRTLAASVSMVNDDTMR